MAGARQHAIARLMNSWMKRSFGKAAWNKCDARARTHTHTRARTRTHTHSLTHVSLYEFEATTTTE